MGKSSGYKNVYLSHGKYYGMKVINFEKFVTSSYDNAEDAHNELQQILQQEPIDKMKRNTLQKHFFNSFFEYKNNNLYWKKNGQIAEDIVELNGLCYRKEHIIYQLHNDTDIPSSKEVVFKNGDKTDFSIDNLELKLRKVRKIV